MLLPTRRRGPDREFVWRTADVPRVHYRVSVKRSAYWSEFARFGERDPDPRRTCEIDANATGNISPRILLSSGSGGKQRESILPGISFRNRHLRARASRRSCRSRGQETVLKCSSRTRTSKWVLPKILPLSGNVSCAEIQRSIKVARRSYGARFHHVMGWAL